jgi:PBSX family phage terminase large subunit
MAINIKIPSKFKPLFQPYRYKVFYGGRGGAKSRSIATALVTKAYQKSLFILCAREMQNSIKDSSKKIIEDEIERQGLGWFFKVTREEITAINGSKFIFKGLRDYNKENIKSIEGVDILWIEEASTLSQESAEVAFPTIRKEGSEIWLSFNPDRKADYVYDTFVTRKRPGSIVVKVNYYDNPWFPDVLREEMEFCKVEFPVRYKKIWLGLPGLDEGAIVKPNWWKTWSSLDEFSNAVYIITADTAWKKGENNDYSVLQLHALHESGVYLVDQIKEKHELPELIIETRRYYEEMKQRYDVRAVFVEEAASGIGLAQTFEREDDIPVVPWPHGGVDKVQRVRDVMMSIYKGQFKIPLDAHWLDEYLEEWNSFKADMSHDHDDQIDASVMAIKIWLDQMGLD